MKDCNLNVAEGSGGWEGCVEKVCCTGVVSGPIDQSPAPET